MSKVLQQAIQLANDGHWDQSHRLVQQLDDPLACWLHANLHREEGDLDNAQYWYHRACREVSTLSVEEERLKIAGIVVGKEGK